MLIRRASDKFNRRRFTEETSTSPNCLVGHQSADGIPRTSLIYIELYLITNFGSKFPNLVASGR